MRQLRTILLCGFLITAAASVAEADVDLAISPAENSQTATPFRLATMTISNDAGHTLTEVRLRWQFGGPTFVYPVTVAPHGAVSLPIRLAALALRQQYQAELSFDGEPTDAPMLATAAIAWPETVVNPGAFIRPADYDRSQTPAWSTSLRRQLLLVAVAAGLLLAASMLLRRPAHRLGTAAFIVAAALVAVIAFVCSQPVVVEHLTEDGVLILTPRRTTSWQTSRADLQPIYASRQQMMEDTTAVSPEGVSVRLTPPQRQLFLRIPPRP